MSFATQLRQHARRSSGDYGCHDSMFCGSEEATLDCDSPSCGSPLQHLPLHQSQWPISIAATEAQTDQLIFSNDSANDDLHHGVHPVPTQCGPESFIASLQQQQLYSDALPETPCGAQLPPGANVEWESCGPSLGPPSGFSVPESPCLEEELASGRHERRHTPQRLFHFTAIKDLDGTDSQRGIKGRQSVIDSARTRQPGAAFASSMAAGNAARDEGTMRTLFSSSFASPGAGERDSLWQDELSGSQGEAHVQCIPETEEQSAICLSPIASQSNKPHRSAKLPDFSRFAFRGTTHLAA